LALAGDHLSVYQLTIEAGTAFAAAHARGDFALPDDELAGALYETTQARLAAAGLVAYEISNHARPDAEARHNLLYWRYGTYAGVGPGAHGRLELDGRRVATETEKLPERWRELVARHGHGLREQMPIASEDAAREQLLMNLRLREGIDLDAYCERWGRCVDSKRMAALVEQGLLRLEGERLRATPRGRLLLNSVITALAG